MTIPDAGQYELAYYSPTKEHPKHSVATVGDKSFLVSEGVVIPSVQSLYMLMHWKIFEGETVLDIGTGSGIQAIFAAENASHIVATDLDLKSVADAKLNIKRHGLSNKIEVRQGDLFAPIGKDEKFDVILFNIDYPYDDETQGFWKVHERFFAAARNHLNPGARIYYQSGLVSNIQHVNDMVTKNKLTIISIRMDSLIKTDRAPIVFLIKRNEDLNRKVGN